jgi:putative transposase
MDNRAEVREFLTTRRAKISPERAGVPLYGQRRDAPLGPRAVADAGLMVEIEAIFAEHKGRYGAPRVHAELRRRGRHVARKRVARLMAAAGLAGRCDRKPLPRTTIADPDARPAPNLVNRNFAPNAPDRVWVTDVTYLRTDAGWCYLAAIIDCHSRLVVGWALDDHMRTDLCLEALDDALARRRPGADLVHHSDRGCQYTSRTYQQKLRSKLIDCSMSRKGNCWDNAVAESFWATLKRELTNVERYISKHDLRLAVFEYIEVYYNRKRLHSSLDYATPEEYDQAHKRRAQAA